MTIPPISAYGSLSYSIRIRLTVRADLGVRVALLMEFHFVQQHVDVVAVAESARQSAHGCQEPGDIQGTVVDVVALLIRSHRG